jgi:hypothetical protein
MNDHLIRYPEERALEHAAFALETTPTRIFRLLLPVYNVEIRATVTEAEPYALIDRYLEHGIAEGRLETVAQLAEFFALDESLVDRAVRFLRAIGHIGGSGDVLTLTELGYRSVRDDVRYEVTRQDRRKLLFDAFGSRPLSRRYYDADSVTFVSPGDPRAGWFRPLTSMRQFRAEALAELARSPDRDALNLPHRIENLEYLGAETVFLPAYVIRAVRSGQVRYLAYTQRGDDNDAEITKLCERTPEITSLLETEQHAVQDGIDRTRVRQRLAKMRLDRYEPERRADGVWQIVLPASAFGKNGLSVTKVGSFIVNGNDVIQVWSPDTTLRHRALFERIDNYLTARARVSPEDLEGRLRQITHQLRLDPIDLPTLGHMARNAGRKGLAAQLNRLS